LNEASNISKNTKITSFIEEEKPIILTDDRVQCAYLKRDIEGFCNYDKKECPCYWSHPKCSKCKVSHKHRKEKRNGEK
jgi:hypothetical protein